MGKQQLKKEIQALPREQLELMILEAYEARKEIKQYFDFFINPDIDKLTDKYILEINKEFRRSKHGRSNARITRIRKLYKEYQGYHPGFDKEIELLMHIITTALLIDNVFYISETMVRGVGALMKQMVIMSDANLVADEVLTKLTALLADKSAGSKYFRIYLKEQLETIRPA